MSECITCQLVARRDTGEAPLWDQIHRTEYFDIVHANNSYLLGWMVIVARRHVDSVADLDPEEARELGMLIHKVSKALHSIVGCVKTYVMQFAEAEGHGHVHFHVVPRMINIPSENKGANVFNYLGADEDSRVPEAEMNSLAQDMKQHLI